MQWDMLTVMAGPDAERHVQGQGKGARPTEKCGVCLHCTRPALRKGCLNPIVRSENPDEAYDLAAKYVLSFFLFCPSAHSVLGFRLFLVA